MHRYVDARAVSSLGAHVERALGWDLADDGAANTDLAGGVKPRHFNSVRRVGDDHVEKTGPRSVLRGEVFWYQHVPEELSDLFPRAVSVSSHPDRDLSSMIMTRVNGVTFSHLAADACLTPGRLGALLDALRRLHVAPARPGSAKPSDALVCSNYAKKVAARFAKHEKFFRSFDDDETGVDTRVMARKVLAFLEDYEKGARFQTAAHVHGDPVFSNVLLTHDGSVKFLDMRGALGDELTTAGDVARVRRAGRSTLLRPSRGSRASAAGGRRVSGRPRRSSGPSEYPRGTPRRGRDVGTSTRRPAAGARHWNIHVTPRGGAATPPPAVQRCKK